MFQYSGIHRPHIDQMNIKMKWAWQNQTWNIVLEIKEASVADKWEFGM